MLQDAGWCVKSGAQNAYFSYTYFMKLSLTLDRDEDSIWGDECPDIPACVSQGKTKPEALKNIKEASRSVSKSALSAACRSPSWSRTVKL